MRNFVPAVRMEDCADDALFIATDEEPEADAGG
jgi:hypothetical protein